MEHDYASMTQHDHQYELWSTPDCLNTAYEVRMPLASRARPAHNPASTSARQNFLLGVSRGAGLCAMYAVPLYSSCTCTAVHCPLMAQGHNRSWFHFSIDKVPARSTIRLRMVNLNLQSKASPRITSPCSYLSSVCSI